MTESTTLLAQTARVHLRDLQIIDGFIDSEGSVNFDFWARTYIRTAVSLFEASIFLLKQTYLEHSREHKLFVEPRSYSYLMNISYSPDNNGELKERSFNTPLPKDIKCFFKLISTLGGPQPSVKYNSKWEDLCAVIKIRHALTHPNSLESQTVSSAQVQQCRNATVWLFDLMHSTDYFFQAYTHHLEDKRDGFE
mgnify:CR=1 FL=1